MKKITLLLFLLVFSKLAAQTEGFESGIPADWAVINGTNGIGPNFQWTATPTPFPSTVTPCAGSNSAFINFEQIGVNNTEEDWLITNQRLVPANGQLRFLVRQLASGDQGTLFQVRVSINPTQTNQSAFTIVQSFTESDLQDLNGDITVCAEKVVDLPASLIGQQVYIAFVRVFTQPTGARGGDRFLLDNVRLTERCLTPNGLDVASVQSTTVQLTWNNPGLASNFEIEIVPAASDPTGSGFTVTAPNTNPTSYTTTPANIVLQAGTNYKYYVRAICGTTETVTSDWAGPFPFTTLPTGSVCSDPLQVLTLPYQSTGNTLNFGDEFDTAQGTLCGATPANTNYLAGNEVFYSYTPTADGIINISMTPSGTPATNSGLFVYAGCSNVGVSCIAGVANAQATVRTLTVNVTAGTTYIIVISSSNTNPSIGYNLIIQNQSCTPPPATLGASEIGLTNATLTWDNPSNFSSWEVVVQAPGAGVPSGSGTEVTALPYLVENLTAATIYEYWVRAECIPGSDLFTTWAGPFVFNTLVCEATSTCNYTFRLRDSGNNGWNNGRMQVRQNGIVVATLGSTITNGGPVDVSVPLCNNIGFDLFWSVAGTSPNQCIVEVINSFGQTIFTKPANSGTPLTVLYTDVVNCTTPRCDLAPTSVAVPTPTLLTNSAVVTWVAPATISWDVYVVPQGNPAPTASTVPTFNDITVADLTNLSFNMTGLIPDTAYTVYIRVNCSPTDSPWSTGVNFTTLPTCPKPTALSVTGIGLTAATFNWTNGTPTDTAWEIYLVPSFSLTPPAQLPAVNPPTDAGQLLIPVSSGSPFTVSDGTLQQARIYYYYVRTVCPGNDKSTWAGPIVFNTITCLPEDKCTYRFVLTDAGGNGWNGARMQVRQNGIIVATIGSTITSGGPTNVNVQICDDIPFDLFWSVEGTAPAEVGVQIQSPFTDILFTKAPGEGTPSTVIYSSMGDCTPPTCPKPTPLAVDVTTITSTSAQLAWTENALPPPGATQWEVYVVPAEGAIPPVNGSPVTGVAPYYLTNSNPFTVEGLQPATTYVFYVRSICSSTDVSTWTILAPRTFTTKPLNDDCAGAITVPVNPTRICAQSLNGSTLGATRTLPNTQPVCQGNTDDDVWFTFTATNPVHIITFSNINGPSNDINHALYSGSDCTALTQLYCSAPEVSVATNLVPNQVYKIRVWTVGGNAAQFANFTVCITTPDPVTNDECAVATPVTPNNGLECDIVVSSAITGATPSSNASTCPGTEDDDVWFSFVANSTTQIITLSNILGTSDNLNHAVYSGTDCNALTLLFCSDPNESIEDNYIDGNTYWIRVWSSVGTPQDITFDLCIGRILPPITTNLDIYTKQQLIEDILLDTSCANVTNITWSTGLDFAADLPNGIGYFNKGLSEFPFQDGIILTTGNAASAPGPNDVILSDGGFGWPGDDDLEAIILEATGLAMNSQNATKLEFDFVPLQDQISFRFIFASEEYGTFQCIFSDAFAFLLTNTLTNETENLAIIPNTTTPVSVVTIRDELYNQGCDSVNPEFFQSFYGDLGVNPIGAPINFNGVTVPMTAVANVTPGVTYHIKLVIADRGDSAFDSAVFLEGGSFDIGNVELGSDFLESAGNAICPGDFVTIDSELDPTIYTFEWTRNGEIIANQNGPSIVVTQPGTYQISASYTNTTCVATDQIIVEFFQDAVAGTPLNLVDCDSTGSSTFDLTQNADAILAPFAAGSHALTYFTTFEDADQNIVANQITNPEAFLGNDQQTIYVRVSKTGTSCYQVVEFDLIVQDLTPVFSFEGVKDLCPEEQTTITVVPTNGSFDTNLVAFSWTFNGNLIATTPSITIDGTQLGNYEVVVNNQGCTNSQTFTVGAATPTWDIAVSGTTELCPDEIGSISAVVTNNTNGGPVIYTFTDPAGVTTTSANSNYTVSEPGTYSVAVSIFGCASAAVNYVISPSSVVWDVQVTGPTELCPDENAIITATVSNNTSGSPVTYIFTNPAGVSTTTNTNTFLATEPGTYQVEVSILGCLSSPVSYTIAPSSQVWDVAFGSSSYVICNNQSVTIDFTALNFDINNPDASYTWTRPDGTQVTGSTIAANQIGTYSLTVEILGCTSTESVSVGEDSINLNIAFETGCVNNQYRITAVPLNNSFDPDTVTYTWTGTAPFQIVSPDSPESIIVGGAGEFTVTVTASSGCSDFETATISNIGCIIQRGISPNNDGAN
ncbi:choice-of-anchor L domain-containing protein, partial [Flavobacterium sp.]|uniref:choice-of-anchor L domain-containing protein n=1 Tax=Flavobacterium sp. TaxID=239 RepID=UPI003B9A2A01